MLVRVGSCGCVFLLVMLNSVLREDAGTLVDAAITFDSWDPGVARHPRLMLQKLVSKHVSDWVIHKRHRPRAF